VGNNPCATRSLKPRLGTLRTTLSLAAFFALMNRRASASSSAVVPASGAKSPPTSRGST
jgi:hypothetical protein